MSKEIIEAENRLTVANFNYDKTLRAINENQCKIDDIIKETEIFKDTLKMREKELTDARDALVKIYQNRLEKLERLKR